jgi:hypothetical protein
MGITTETPRARSSAEERKSGKCEILSLSASPLEKGARGLFLCDLRVFAARNLTMSHSERRKAKDETSSSRRNGSGENPGGEA